MARIFIISNRVATPQAGLHAGGLEVVLKATLKNHPCVWMGWSGEIKAHPKTRTLYQKPAPSLGAFPVRFFRQSGIMPGRSGGRGCFAPSF